MIKHRIQEDVDELVQGEKLAQKHATEFYKSLGWQVDRLGACVGYDCILSKDGRRLKIEEKFRQKDYNDFLVELIQAAETGQLGWHYHTQADRLLYVICGEDWTPTKFYIVLWKRFKVWFVQYQLKNKVTWIKSLVGIGISYNISIPWRNIPSNLWELKEK